MMRRPLPTLLLVLALVACASTRQKALRTTAAATVAAQTAFIEWDAQAQIAIAQTAPSFEEGIAQLNAYKAKRETVIAAFEFVWRSIAKAAVLEEEMSSLVTVPRAFERLRVALSSLTKGALP